MAEIAVNQRRRRGIFVEKQSIGITSSVGAASGGRRNMLLLTELEIFGMAVLQRCRPSRGWIPAAFGLIKGLDRNKVEVVNARPIPLVFRCTAIMLVVMTWNSLAFCGEIHDAAAKGDVAMVKALLQANPDLVFSKDTLGQTPLHLAATSGHTDMVKLLLANNAKENDKANDGSTPLHYAASHGNKEVAKLLLANKADIDARDNFDETPLHYAATQGHKDVVELLLTNKAMVNAKDKQGYTPLHWAAGFGQTGVAELLLANKAEVNAKDNQGFTPLHFAATRGNKKDMVELLLAKGADVNAKADDGLTPLRDAAKSGQKEMAELLRQHGGQ